MSARPPALMTVRRWARVPCISKLRSCEGTGARGGPYGHGDHGAAEPRDARHRAVGEASTAHARMVRGCAQRRAARQRPPPATRSEEHTSELQSPCNLVCRLLLEKKKKIENRESQVMST